jgi:hypothetical protein
MEELSFSMTTNDDEKGGGQDLPGRGVKQGIYRVINNPLTAH